MSQNHLPLELLPDSTQDLFYLFDSSPQHSVRITALAKIKYQLVSSLEERREMGNDLRVVQTVERIFSKKIIEFMKKSKYYPLKQQSEQRLFFHVVSLAIKHFFREDTFKALIAYLTELLDSQLQGVRPTLDFFTEVIKTIEDSSDTEPRCRFERHLINEHINSMLTLANFIVQRGNLPEGISIEEARLQEHFQIMNPEDTLLAALTLVRTCVCFDWLHEKKNDFQETWEMSSLVIPTKRVRQGGQTEFDKWLKNTEWVRLYSFLFREAHDGELRGCIGELLGDLARVHMKFFRNKVNYRMFIQNLAYCFSQVLQGLELSKNSQENIKVAIIVLSNLGKLVTGTCLPMLFEINSPLFDGILQNLRLFLVEEVIGEQIMNTNIFYFSFTFLEKLMNRSRFEKKIERIDQVEGVLREICRHYQTYIRTLFNNMRKKLIITGNSIEYRMDYLQLKEWIQFYCWKDLQVFFFPFKLMKPRYSTTNSIHELFIYIVARVYRATSILQLYRIDKWEKDVAHTMIAQSVSKIQERFGFTAYKRTRQNGGEDWSNSSSQLEPLPPISEHYEQEIENEEEYCHMLRLASFLIIEELLPLSLDNAKPLLPSFIKLTNITIELCLGADLQEGGNKEWKNLQYQSKIEEGFRLLPNLCRKAFSKEYERSVFSLQQTHQLLNFPPVRYRYNYPQGEIQLLDNQLENEAFDLLKTIESASPFAEDNFLSVLIEIKLLTLIAMESQCPDLPDYLLSSPEMCILCLETIESIEILKTLLIYKQKRLNDFVVKMLRFVDGFECKEEDLDVTLRLLRKLGECDSVQVREQAINKIYCLLNCLMPYLEKGSEYLLEELQLLCEGVLKRTNDQDIAQLRQKIRQILSCYMKIPEEMQLDTTYLSLADENSSKNHFDRPNPESVGMEIEGKSVEIEVESQGKSIELGKEINIDKGSSLPQQPDIYCGYHRQNTMKLVDKYIQQYSHDTISPKKIKVEDVVLRTPDKKIELLQQDTQFPKQPRIISLNNDKVSKQQTTLSDQGKPFSQRAPQEQEDKETTIYLPSLQEIQKAHSSQRSIREGKEKKYCDQVRFLKKEDESGSQREVEISQESLRKSCSQRIEESEQRSLLVNNSSAQEKQKYCTDC